MPELSTLLRQRLRATEDRSLPHPDADVLTAYAEELLPTTERDEVVQHLSRCSQCREVVALTMPDVAAQPEPQVEAAPATVAAVPRRRWFLTPAFGFAGSLAAVVLGVALILRLPQNTHQFNGGNTAQQAQNKGVTVNPAANADRLASNESAPAPAAQQPAAKAEPAVTARTESQQAAVAEMRETSPARIPRASQQSRTETVTRNAAPVFMADARQQDYVNKMFLANGYQAGAPSNRDLPQAPVPVQSNLAFAPPGVVAGNSFQGNGTFGVPANSPAAGQGVVTIYSRQSSDKGLTLMGKIVDLGKHPLGRHLGPPISSGSVGRSAMFKPGLGVTQPSDAIAASSHRGDEDTGVLAKSQAFTSNALAALPRRQMLGTPQYQWKVVQGKLLRSSDLTHWTEENPAGENLEFSVVSPNGPEIWAGGAQAALVHSRDGGTSWERITLGAAATGTITSIEVAGQNLQVKSSSGQSWASQDGGGSWALQD